MRSIPLDRRWLSCSVLCLLTATFPVMSQAQSAPPGDGTDVVLWENAPVAWLEQGQIVLHVAERFDLDVPSRLSGGGPPSVTPGESESVTFPTGFGLEFFAERTVFNAKGQPESPPTRIPYGGIWVATTLARDVAAPYIQDVIESLASGPLGSFEKRAPIAGNLDSAQFFTFTGSPFFTEAPTWVCYELPDMSFAGRTLTGQPWTAPTGAPAVRKSIGSSSSYAPVCRAVMDAIKTGAEDPTSFPTRLVYERKPRRRLILTLFRSYEATNEVTAAGSRLVMSEEKLQASMPSNPELDLWLAQSAPVVLRFALEEVADEQGHEWTALAEWLVAVHLSKVDRPEGGVEEDMLRWEEDIVALAKTDLRENLAQALQGVSVLDASDLQSASQGQFEGFRGGILIESLSNFLGKKAAIAVVCGEGRAVYSLFPSPASWMQIQNGDTFCADLNLRASKLERVRFAEY